MDYELEYSMRSNPEWIHDQGKGRITIRGMTISMRLEPEVLPGGRLTARVVEDPKQEIVMTDYNVEFEGQTDFSRAADFILNNLKDFFRAEVAGILTSSASQAFQEIMNGLVNEYQGPTVHALPDTQGKVNLNLTLTNPKVFVFGKDQFSIPLDGTFLDEKKQGRSETGLPRLPTAIPNAKAQPDLQLYISQYTLQSALTAYHKAGLLQFKLTQLSSDLINIMFDNFSNVFGNGNKAGMELRSIGDEAPTIKVTASSTTI